MIVLYICMFTRVLVIVYFLRMSFGHLSCHPDKGDQQGVERPDLNRCHAEGKDPSTGRLVHQVDRTFGCRETVISLYSRVTIIRRPWFLNFQFLTTCNGTSVLSEFGLNDTQFKSSANPLRSTYFNTCHSVGSLRLFIKNTILSGTSFSECQARYV
jgi:hypothetical protein